MAHGAAAGFFAGIAPLALIVGIGQQLTVPVGNTACLHAVFLGLDPGIVGAGEPPVSIDPHDVYQIYAQDQEHGTE